MNFCILVTVCDMITYFFKWNNGQNMVHSTRYIPILKLWFCLADSVNLESVAKKKLLSILKYFYISYVIYYKFVKTELHTILMASSI